MRILLSVFALIAMSAPSFAAKLGPAGCGLGNMVMGTENQVLASTTNGTGVQSFGITTGTSNCEQAGGMAKLNNYIDVNQFALANDVARGEGETISGLAEILGCQDASQLGTTLKAGYSDLFSRPGVSTQELSNGVRNAVQRNSELLNTCHNA